MYVCQPARAGFLVTTAIAALGPIVGCVSYQKLGAAECKGQICDPLNWIVLHFWSDVWFQTPWAGPTSYCPEFASSDNRFLAASARQSDGFLLATVTEDGVLRLATFGTASAGMELNANAVSAAWSNAGDRLAVVCRTEAPTEYLLDILSPDLSPIAVFHIDLPVPDTDPHGRHLAVSWNSGDEVVAVSTTIGTAGARLVFLESGDVVFHNLGDVYFLSNDTIVATDPSCQPCTVLFDLDARELKNRRVLPNALKPLTSDPRSGVFATQEFDYGLNAAIIPAGLRTEKRGPSEFGVQVYDDQPLVLLPMEWALPVLDAAGYGPEDAEPLDPNGSCP